jgi:hypothetical protein
MGELSFKNDICIGMKYVFVFFRFFRIFFQIYYSKCGAKLKIL